MNSAQKNLVFLGLCSLFVCTPLLTLAEEGNKAAFSPSFETVTVPGVMLRRLEQQPLQTKPGAPFLNGSCSNEDLNEVEYDQIWSLADHYFLYRERMKNWNSWRHKFDGRLASDQSLESAVGAMLGSLKDRYTFFRNAEETELRSRQDSETNVVEWRPLGDSVGYMRIKTFCSRNCVSESRAAIGALASCRALIVDLRDNGGGCIDDAAGVFSLFAEKGTFVSLRGIAAGKIEHEEMILQPTGYLDTRSGGIETKARQSSLAEHKTIVVLINDSTKSAAEMLAGALRDNRKAKLVGTRSFGKGVAQRIWQFENGTSIKITSARFYLPSGRTINGAGLVPDKTVLQSKDRDLQLAKARDILTRSSDSLGNSHDHTLFIRGSDLLLKAGR